MSDINRKRGSQRICLLAGCCVGYKVDGKKVWQLHDSEGQIGGESGIRTHGTLARTHAFQACALSRSAISPARRRL